MNPIPQIYDTARRVARTAIQIAGGFVAFAAIYPLIVDAIGVPKESTVGRWLAASAVTVGLVSLAITRVMAIPAVNAVLAKIKLAGHSGNITAGDTYTTLLAVQPAATSSGEAVSGDGIH